jgi:uroporphyrinogen-III decarboxylase
MNHRDRALAAMCGEPVDRIPFIARMDLWYSYHRNSGTLPAPYEKATLWDLQRDLGVGIFGFGVWDQSFYQLVPRGIEIRKTIEDGAQVTRVVTPYGTLTMRDKMSAELMEAAGAGARIEFPFKSENDYDALLAWIEHTEVVENYTAYGQFVNSIGGDGLALPFSGHLPAHQLMINVMGYEKFYYEMNDHPARLQQVIDALNHQQQQILKLAANCPAQAIEVGGNYDEQMTPPRIFESLFAPFYRQARQVLEPAGKIIVIHGDGEMKKLRAKIRECGIQVVEAVTPKPMTSIDVADTRRIWGDAVTFWGGVASVMLTSVFSEAEFEQHLDDLFRAVAPGQRFILGFGDNVPTDALFHRVKRVAEYWHAHSTYPIHLDS